MHEHLFQVMEEAVSGNHPDTVALNPFLTMTLQSEIAYTFECGIYPTCRFGGRIEENGIVTESGDGTLFGFPRALVTLE